MSTATRAATPAVTAQALQANAAFLAYAPPPAQPGALCLVDTGVHTNPDTQPGLLSATAIDGGTGDDVDPGGHGTTMAMIAGAAGVGMVGAWPQLKIVSVRAVDPPTPGQEPTFIFDYYAQAMNRCVSLAVGDHVHAIDLALSSSIPPTSDEAQIFAARLAAAHNQNVAVLAAAGNQPGAVEEPGGEPGVLAVGAATAQSNSTSMTPVGVVCSFSASQGLTFFAPGCGMNEANPFTDVPKCCGNGTSQASAFAGGVLVALMSYDPTLTYSRAEQLLVSTATDGDLNVAVAFQADGLGNIVAEGNANIPHSSPAPASSVLGSSTPAAHAGFAVRRVSWRRGVLSVDVAGLARGERLRLTLTYARRGARQVVAHHERVHIHTSRPRLVIVQELAGNKAGPPITVSVG
jgi:hypothetical protein